MSIVQRSVTSTAWNVAAKLASLSVLVVRSILLARLLPVETFGTYTLAGSVVGLSAVVATFGMGGAFLHRTLETADEEQTAAVHFTLKCIFVLVWATLVTTGAFLFTSGETRIALLALTITTSGIELTQTPRLILTRRIVHRRLALIQVLNTVLTTIVALGLAWRGMTLWALLSTDLVTLALMVIGLYVWRPVWRPRMEWAPAIVRYFLRFGSRVFLGTLLQQALDRVDDLWTGLYLGTTSLGFYSRAYTFATYPRSILAEPISLVADGTYAELKGKRQSLSQAFFQINALLIRSGFFLAGLLALLAPEFINLVLGAKWLPMLDAFRLMLVYTLLDPIKITIAGVLTTSGAPEKVVRTRVIQLVVMIAGLVILGPRLGIAGVALAVDLMLVVGMVLLLWEARAYVDFSLRMLFGVPAAALIVALMAARLAIRLPGIPGSDWIVGGIKGGVFVLVYAGLVALLERKNIPRYLALVRHLRPTPPATSQHSTPTGHEAANEVL